MTPKTKTKPIKITSFENFNEKFQIYALAQLFLVFWMPFRKWIIEYDRRIHRLHIDITNASVDEPCFSISCAPVAWENF